jgi:predicted XRE-type DNA-binding protein
LGITQPRLSDLYRGKISKFSLDALVEIASKLGIHVRIEVEPDFAVPSGT